MSILFCFLFSFTQTFPIGLGDPPDSVSPPNVILILTDDQGIGDLSVHGNPWLKTPHLDAFYEEAVRMTNFHVSPLCTPTRGALMTGQYPIHNGAWATFKGRDALSEGAFTLADLFQQNGYTTGLFGKWHLGDNYPVRPTDCGFDLAVQHKAGGVGELSDYWGNTYFDDVYYVNNEPRQYSGYCTDIWFQEAQTFMDTTKAPFFAYLATNAPHSPLVVAESYSDPYQEGEGTLYQSAAYYGMIANIDENFGKLVAFLERKGLEDNTILIFMTDNGTQFGYNEEKNWGFNKGFRGNKGGKLEGSHRVPFFLRWPQKGWNEGVDREDLVAHIDVFPTLASLCELEIPEEAEIDGIDFSASLNGEDTNLRERSIFVHNRQDWRPPDPTKGASVMKGNWRLLDGKELYHIQEDPAQRQELSAKYPEIVQQLRAENEAFFASIPLDPIYQELPVQVVGSPHQKAIKLTIQHAIGEDSGIWKPEQVAAGVKNTNNTHALRIEQSGTYRIACRRWPVECPGPILGIPSENPKDQYEYQAISPDKVRIQIANQMLEKTIKPEEEAVGFEVELSPGKTFLVTDFIEGSERYGVYYTYIERVELETP